MDGNQSLLSGRAYPHYVKYMGSKSKIMDFVLEGLRSVYAGGPICDLFAGSASLAGAIGDRVPVHSNDIQAYSAVLADAYLTAYRHPGMADADFVLAEAEKAVLAKLDRHQAVITDYDRPFTLEEFVELEARQQNLISEVFADDWHLFTKYYSGTWWSAEQCLWIDSIREQAERYRGTPSFALLLSSLMYAMAYTSQGTGHYAQYRDAKTTSSLKDILIYRRRSVAKYFRRKYDEVMRWAPESAPLHDHRTTALDFRDCLRTVSGGTVYADPPYCFVHYSRFYHAIETLVRYDYPSIQVKGGKVVKGRYRDDRHQSPFCIRSQVTQAFRDMFDAVQKADAALVLSYSNTGMISVEEVGALIKECLPGRTHELVLTNHQHMTLGRLSDRHRDVEECLFLVR